MIRTNVMSISKYLKLLLLTIILISHFSAAQNATEKCQALIQSWMGDKSKLSPISYADSGKFLNDLGDYNNCLFNKDQYTYFTMSVVNRLVRAYQFMGLCAPNECRELIQSNKYSKEIQDHLNEMYQNATNTTTIAFAGLQFYIPSENQPQMDWSNYLTIAFLSFLVILGIVGSLVSKFSQGKGIVIKIMKSFSLVDNVTKIVTIVIPKQNQNLLFLNGARVLSIFWIVFGHDEWWRFFNIKNWTQTLDILTTPGIPTLAPAAYFAVDTFFWIGGFLITLGMLQMVKKQKSFIKFYLGSVLHRFIRIWPTYMVAILLFWKVAPFFGNGPIWRSFYNLSCSCNNGGVLWNMFFIDNFGNHGPNGMDYCFGWGWYLAVDFQLFLITPMILYTYHKNKKIGWILTFVLFLSSVLCAFLMIYVNDWRYPIPNPHFAPQPQFMDKFYYKPYIRASAYFMGIFSGYIYVDWKNGEQKVVKVINKIKGSILLRVLFYVIGIFLCQFTIWIIVPYQTGKQWSTLTQAFYNSFNRVFFLIGMYMCIFAGMFGCKHDPAKFILGHWIFSPLAKVSFCVYLTHFIVIMNGTFSARMELFWQETTSLYIVITDIFWSVVCATFLSALVESPILGMEKVLMGGGKDRKQKIKEKGEKMEVKEQLQLQTPLIINQPSIDNIAPVKDGQKAQGLLL